MGSAKAEFKLCGKPADITAIYRALIAEASQPGTPRKGSIDVNIKNDCLKISIASNELGDLRALVNSYLYLVYASYSVIRRLSLDRRTSP